jgi:hypothetical protein
MVCQSELQDVSSSEESRSDGMKTVKEMMAVMQAWLDGRKIEVKPNTERVWNEVGMPQWDWYNCDYRIKPEDVKVYLYRSRITGELFSSIHLIPEDQAEFVGQATIVAEGGQSHPPKRKIQ